MVSQEIAKKIRLIEISTRRMLSGSLVGDSRSALKGFGFDFDQIRDYVPGDDVRFIDWKSSSRVGKFLVKQYIQERNRKIMLVIDVSSSHFFSSTETLRSDYVAQVASVIALVADHGKDAVGLMLFSDTVELYIPPQCGRKHIRMLIAKLFSCKPSKKTTNISAALDALARIRTMNALVFLLSDFIDNNFEKSLSLVAKKFEVIALSCIDDRELSLPDCGFITVQDSETGRDYVLDTRGGSRGVVDQYLQKRVRDQHTMFKRFGIDYVQLKTGKPFIRDLITYFRRRMVY